MRDCCGECEKETEGGIGEERIEIEKITRNFHQSQWKAALP